MYLRNATDFFAPANCTIGNEHDLYKFGKCVMVKLVITTTTAMSGLLYIGKLSSAYAPKMQARLYTSSRDIFGFVNADGTMYIKDSTGATHGSNYYADIWITYMTD